MIESDLAEMFFEVDGESFEVADQRQLSVLLIPGKNDLHEYDSEDAVPLKVREHLDSEAVKLQDDYFGEFRVICAELVIGNKSKVTLFGQVEQLPDADGSFTGYREVSTRPRMTQPTEGPYIITKTQDADLIIESISSLTPDALRELYLGIASGQRPR